MMKKYIITIAIIALIGFGIYKKVYIPKHTYETITAVKSDMDVRVNGVGNVGAKDIYKIGSIYGGKVFDLTVNEGDFIKQGTVMATIDSIDLKPNHFRVYTLCYYTQFNMYEIILFYGKTSKNIILTEYSSPFFD